MGKEKLERLRSHFRDSAAQLRVLEESINSLVSSDEFYTLSDRVKGVIYAACWAVSETADLLTSAHIVITESQLRGYKGNAPKSNTDAPVIDDNAKEV